MYVLINNGSIEKYPYSIGELRKDNPHTSFPKNPSPAVLAEWNVFPVKSAAIPSVDPIMEDFREGTPEFVNGEWVQVWIVTPASDEEIARRKQDLVFAAQQNRLVAYRDEADPLFFKAQRGEATMEQWTAKVQEIKQRFPIQE